jgi:hypothetical protein
MQAIAYCRVNTAAQGEHGVSLEMQRDRIAAWCMGMPLVIMMRAIGVPRAVNPLATPEVAFNVGQQGFYLLGSIGHTGQ